MNQPRNYFLSHAGFAGDQNLRVRAGGAVDIGRDGLDGLASTDQTGFGEFRRRQSLALLATRVAGESWCRKGSQEADILPVMWRLRQSVFQ